MASSLEYTPAIEGDSEDDFDWEEVEVPERQHLEITLQERPKVDANKKKGISHAERLIRIDCHKIHTIALLGNASARNIWINDPLLHARLLSLTPLPLQNAFGTIHKSRVPDHNQRGRLFEAALTRLVEWWSNTFEISFDGHIRNRTFDEIQTLLQTRSLISQDNPDAEMDMESIQDLLNDEGELIRSSKSLMKHALMQSGSRDTSAQLFTALCRALGIPARLVVSLQSMPWQAGVGKPKPKYEKKTKGKGRKGKGNEQEEGTGGDEEEDEDMEEVSIPHSRAGSVVKSDVKGKGKAKEFQGEGQRLDGEAVIPKSDKARGKEKAKPIIKLRKAKNVMGGGSSTPTSLHSRYVTPDPTSTPPVFWTEVFSRPDARWLPVDPIRCIVNKRKVFDPSPSTTSPNSAPSSIVSTPAGLAFPLQSKAPKNVNRGVRQENRMIYVLAFEEDGYARDVTRRYAKEFLAKVAKVQGGSRGGATGGGGKGRQAWWDRVVNTIRRPYQLHRDDVEDEELEAAQAMEGMPTTISGFKDHPLYVLTRHLKQTETIHPPPPATPQLGKFRGEPVYPRSSVVSLKTAENWLRSEGRTIKEGCQPMKFIKMRAGTVGRMRELEILKDELKEAGTNSENTSGPNGETISNEVMQGMYARSQTELYIPDPILNGKIPKNNFGNIDLYVPSMLPKGGSHIPFKGVVKIVRKLGFDFAEAVTGFEFKKRRAYPIIDGVVVANENEAAVLEAYWDAEQDAEEKARIKREERVIKRWTRLVQGLRIRQRLQEQYAPKPTEESKLLKTSANDEAQDDVPASPHHDTPKHGGGGGYVEDADHVVQAFHLPKYQHVDLPFFPTSEMPVVTDHVKYKHSHDKSNNKIPDDDPVSYGLETMEVDVDVDEIPTPSGISNVAPKTMRELAEDAARQLERQPDDIDSGMAGLGASPSMPAQVSGRPIPRPVIKITGPKPSKNNNGHTTTKGKTREPAAKRKSTRKRRRDDNDEESDQDEHGADEPSPVRAKRAKATVAVTPAAPTRTLRPRAVKSQAALEEERDREEAFRRAVAR